MSRLVIELMRPYRRWLAIVFVAMLVEIAGITQYGTDAASDLVTNPDLMSEALQTADAGWQRARLGNRI